VNVVSVTDGQESMSCDRVMHEGQVFADREMLTKSTHKKIMRARGHVELLALSNADLTEVLREFPDVYQSVNEYAMTEYDYDISLE